jgi:hypothetical protein
MHKGAKKDAAKSETAKSETKSEGRRAGESVRVRAEC